MSGKPVHTLLTNSLSHHRLHLTLFDPAKMDSQELGTAAAQAEKAGTTAIMLGGSTDLSMKIVDESVLAVRAKTSLPVILFPTAAATLSRHADALFFMSMLNSTDLRYVIGEQVKGSVFIKNFNLEPLSMGYVVVEPGMVVGEVGKAAAIPRNDYDSAVRYCLAAQYLGMRYLYLEAGSGAPEPVPVGMVREVSENIDIPLIVGGGIKNPEQVRSLAQAGADIIVTGTLVETSDDIEKVLTPLIKTLRES